MKLNSKITMALILSGLIPITIISGIAINNSYRALKTTNENNLISLREIKKAEIENTFKEMSKQTRQAAGEEFVFKAFKEFNQAYNEVPTTSLAEKKNNLKNFYLN